MNPIDRVRKLKDSLLEGGMRRGYYSLHQLLVFEYFIRLIVMIVIIVVPLVVFYRMCGRGFFGSCTNTTFEVALKAGYFAIVLWIIFIIAKPVISKREVKSD